MSYEHWGANILVASCTVGAVVAAVSVHYEGLLWSSRWIAKPRHAQRQTVLYAILALIALHITEIWIFGVGYHLLLLNPDSGTIDGAISTSLLDHVYFSAVVFSTVGFGDLAPLGPIRFMAGTEALTGLVLIGWSASFTYLEMQQLWRNERA